MTIENLTFMQIGCFANSGDIDTAQFGARALRLLNLVVNPNPSNEDCDDMRNLHVTLSKNLANAAFVAHLRKSAPNAFVLEVRVVKSDKLGVVRGAGGRAA